MADVVERLQGQTTDQRGIAHDHRDPLHRMAHIAGGRQTLRDRQARSGMAAVEHVVLRLLTPWKATDPAQLAQRPELGVAPGKQLVDVGLMTRVPDDLVTRRFQNAVQSQCQLDDSERGAEVAAGPGDGRDYVFADLTCQCVQLAVGEAAQVARALQPGQDCQFRLLLGGSPGRALMVEAYFRVESPVPLDLPNSSTGPSPFCVPGSSERQSTAPALPRLGERLTASSGGPWARYSPSAASAA